MTTSPPKRPARRAAPAALPRLAAALVIALLGSALLPAACGTAPLTPGGTVLPAAPTATLAASAASRAGLLVLAGPAGARRLHVLSLDGTAGPVAALTGPSADASWLSVSSDARLVLTLAQRRSLVFGRLLASGEPQLDEPVRIDPRGLDPAARPTWFASWSPNGDGLAMLAVDLGRLAPWALLLGDRSGAGQRLLPMIGEAEAAAPAWLDDERLLVLERDTAERVRPRIVDLRTGRAADAPLVELYAIAVSSDATTIALARRDGSGVRVGSLATWLRGGEMGGTTIPVPAAGPGALSGGGSTPTVVALDAKGQRLAIGWQSTSGETTVRVYDGRAGWRAVASTTVLDGVVALAWLP